MRDSYMLRAMSRDGSVRLFAEDSSAIVKRAAEIHGTSKTMTAVLGRSLTAASLMGVQLKSAGSSLTLNIRGDGGAGSIVCVSDESGDVRGCAENPAFRLPANAAGKLDVGGAVGHGMLYVIRDEGAGEPYSGSVPIVSGEIAQDITEYYAVSEQVPTVCALGVRVELEREDTVVRAAGGFILQLMPGADEGLIPVIEKNVAELGSVSAQLAEGATPEDLAALALKSIDFDILETRPVAYRCDCARERYARALVSLGSRELRELTEDGKPAEIVCRFCGSKYEFSHEELLQMSEAAQARERSDS